MKLRGNSNNSARTKYFDLTWWPDLWWHGLKISHTVLYTIISRYWKTGGAESKPRPHGTLVHTRAVRSTYFQELQLRPRLRSYKVDSDSNLDLDVDINFDTYSNSDSETFICMLQAPTFKNYCLQRSSETVLLIKTHRASQSRIVLKWLYLRRTKPDSFKVISISFDKVAG